MTTRITAELLAVRRQYCLDSSLVEGKNASIIVDTQSLDEGFALRRQDELVAHSRFQDGGELRAGRIDRGFGFSLLTRFFGFFPKAQPPRIGPVKPPPQPVILAGLYAAWIAVTLVTIFILTGAMSQ